MLLRLESERDVVRVRLKGRRKVDSNVVIAGETDKWCSCMEATVLSYLVGTTKRETKKIY